MGRLGSPERTLFLCAALFGSGLLASASSDAAWRGVALVSMTAAFALIVRLSRRMQREVSGSTATRWVTSDEVIEWLQRSPATSLSWDGKFRMHSWNAQAERLFGMAMEQVRGAPAPDFVMPLCTLVSDRLASSGVVDALEVSVQNERDELLQLVVSAVRLPRSQDHLDVALVFNCTQARNADSQRLNAADLQRDALIREVHHRIKNHLQGVAGLLRQHLAGKPLLKPVLDAATSQVLSIAAVHGLQGEADSRLDLHSLTSRIAASISSIMHAPIVLEESCRVLQGVHLADEEAVPMAMVLNELFINAVKHRSVGPQSGLLRVSATRDPGEVRIVIANPGFLPPRFNFSLGAHVGTGLALVKSLLPARGAVLEIEERNAHVEARLVLHAPYVRLDERPGDP